MDWYSSYLSKKALTGKYFQKNKLLEEIQLVLTTSRGRWKWCWLIYFYTFIKHSFPNDTIFQFNIYDHLLSLDFLKPSWNSSFCWTIATDSNIQHFLKELLNSFALEAFFFMIIKALMNISRRELIDYTNINYIWILIGRLAELKKFGLILDYFGILSVSFNSFK